MRNSFTLLAAVAVTSLVATGCAGPEQKFSRGLSNSTEILRLGELRRSMEQTFLLDGPGAASTTGFVKGMNKTLARTGLGLYEVVTFPIPSYEPVWTNYLSAKPVFPDNYRPRRPTGSLYATDTALGFSGGDMAPNVPGSRFHVFDD